MTGRDSFDNGVRKPSALLQDVIDGKTALGDADEAIQSWFRLWVYQRADAVLQHRSSDDRRAALNKEPAIHREAIEAEVRRLFEIRKAKT
jgi:hypothetical protein